MHYSGTRVSSLYNILILTHIVVMYRWTIIYHNVWSIIAHTIHIHLLMSELMVLRLLLSCL